MYCLIEMLVSLVNKPPDTYLLEIIDFPLFFYESVTDRRTDGGRTDRPSYRHIRTHLKTELALDTKYPITFTKFRHEKCSRLIVFWIYNWISKFLTHLPSKLALVVASGKWSAGNGQQEMVSGWIQVIASLHKDRILVADTSVYDCQSTLLWRAVSIWSFL